MRRSTSAQTCTKPRSGAAPAVTGWVLPSAPIGTPTVSKATVTGEILAQSRHPKVIVFKKRRRKNYRRTNGHRQSFTKLKITGISEG